MAIYVLLRGLAASGRIHFHGITNSEPEAQAWEAGGAANWFYTADLNDGSVVDRNPITYNTVNGIGAE